MDVVFAILGHNANIFSEVLELQISVPEGKPATAAAATETDETPEGIPVAKASGEQKKRTFYGCTLLQSWFVSFSVVTVLWGAPGNSVFGFRLYMVFMRRCKHQQQ